MNFFNRLHQELELIRDRDGDDGGIAFAGRITPELWREIEANAGAFNQAYMETTFLKFLLVRDANPGERCQCEHAACKHPNGCDGEAVGLFNIDDMGRWLLCRTCSDRYAGDLCEFKTTDPVDTILRAAVKLCGHHGLTVMKTYPETDSTDAALEVAYGFMDPVAMTVSPKVFNIQISMQTREYVLGREIENDPDGYVFESIAADSRLANLIQRIKSWKE